MPGGAQPRAECTSSLATRTDTAGCITAPPLLPRLQCRQAALMCAPRIPSAYQPTARNALAPVLAAAGRAVLGRGRPGGSSLAPAPKFLLGPCVPLCTASLSHTQRSRSLRSGPYQSSPPDGPSTEWVGLPVPSFWFLHGFLRTSQLTSWLCLSLTAQICGQALAATRSNCPDY